MTVSKPALLVSALVTFLLAYPAFADEKSGQMTSGQILAHPEVKGALAAIDAFVEGVQIYDYIKGQILEPLGLSNTRTYYPVEMRGDQLAIGYTGMHRSGKREPVEPFFTRGITAAAGFTSSVNDLASFASWKFRLLENGGKEVLSANTLREMHRVHWVDPDWETTWGIGFGIRRVEDTTLIGHGGGCPGYITGFLMVPKYKIAAIVLTNAGDGPAGMIAQNMLKTIGTAYT